MEFLWLKLSYACFILIKFSKFISKKVDLEACFLCSRASRRLKHALFYSKLKFSIIKVVSDLLYLARLARNIFIVTHILENSRTSDGRFSPHDRYLLTKIGQNVGNCPSVNLASKFLRYLDV